MGKEASRGAKEGARPRIKRKKQIDRQLPGLIKRVNMAPLNT
jgi:hypothetical protein